MLAGLQALVETVEKPIITEYSSVLSQFKAGNIYSFGSYLSGPQITADDVLPTKRDDPRILIYQGEYAGAGLIGSRRGRVGGYVLIKDSKTISVGAILRMIDGPMAT